jgi:hypothetical protein
LAIVLPIGEDRGAVRDVINPSGLLTIRGHKKGHVPNPETALWW